MHPIQAVSNVQDLFAEPSRTVDKQIHLDSSAKNGVLLQ
jgi:hypothetical protein